MQGGGQTLNGFNRKTVLRNRCYRRNSEYHLAPRCPWRDTLRRGGGSFSQERDRSQRPPYFSTSSDTPVVAQKAGSVGESEAGSEREQSFVGAADAGDVSMVSRGDSVVALDTGATAKLLCSSWLARHSRILERRWSPRVTTCPSQTRFRFGDGRLGVVRHAADIPLGIVGNEGALTASALDGYSPALLRKGAMEALG